MKVDLKVVFRPEVYAEIDFYVQKCSIECSGLGRVLKHPDGTLEVTKIYLLEQENAAAETNLSGDAIAKLMYESRMDQEEYGNLNFWWHSHVDMSVNWSVTDHTAIKQIGKNGYVLASVFNKRKQVRSAYYQGENHELFPPVFFDELPTTVLKPSYKEKEEQWAKDLEEKSKRLTSRYGGTYLGGDTDMYGFKTYSQYRARPDKGVKPYCQSYDKGGFRYYYSDVHEDCVWDMTEQMWRRPISKRAKKKQEKENKETKAVVKELPPPPKDDGKNIEIAGRKYSSMEEYYEDDQFFKLSCRDSCDSPEEFKRWEESFMKVNEVSHRLEIDYESLYDYMAYWRWDVNMAERFKDETFEEEA